VGLADAKLVLDALEAIGRIETKIDNLGALMATAAEQINALSTKVDGLSTLTADIHADFRAFRDAMTAERENLTAAGQAALDEANAKADVAATALADLDVEVGDADGSDVPPPPLV
jgi:hypothetical protein